MIFSYSRLETYEQCPQKFKFAYLDQIESDIEGIESFMGSRVHEALYKLYFDLRHTKIDSLDEIIVHYRERWEEEWHPGIQIVREGLTPEHYRSLGEKCLSDYYRRYEPFNQSRTLGLEHYVSFSLDRDGKCVMQGYIDRISQPKEGVVWIHDYKAKGYLPSQQEADGDKQLAFYQMAIQQIWPDVKEIELVWHHLIYDKEVRSRRSAEELEGLRGATLKLIESIESAKEFPARQSALCGWCEYRPRCPLYRHEYDLAALPENRYLQDGAVQLVERLAELQTEEEGIKKEIDQVKSALVAIAQSKGYEVFFGRTHKVRIKFYDSWKFPGKNDPGRAELERSVKESGRWMEVSMLDVFALSKALIGAGWSPELVAKLQAFGRREKHPWVKLMKKDDR
ncbi:MAG TPA: PD-(D/E)XK nuclease family protein [Nitrospiria bacterium]|nr:PD-(D/E)XK nuclease family protein [Nitrospiria bacterium]